VALNTRQNISSAAGIVYTEAEALDQGDLQTLLGAYRELSVTTPVRKVFEMAVEWGGTHSKAVVWGGTHEESVEWGGVHSRPVKWED
jgi:hypothetical protein